MLSELRPEDAGEVRFQAGPAQSVAQLEVEGKLLGRNGREWASSSLPLGSPRLAAGPGNAASLPPRLPSSRDSSSGEGPLLGEEETLGYGGMG